MGNPIKPVRIQKNAMLILKIAKNRFLHRFFFDKTTFFRISHICMRIHDNTHSCTLQISILINQITSKLQLYITNLQTKQYFTHYHAIL